MPSFWRRNKPQQPEENEPSRPAETLGQAPASEAITLQAHLIRAVDALKGDIKSTSVNDGDEDEGKTYVVEFKYQQVFFIALVAEGSSHICLGMSSILDVELSELNEVRFLCNRFNPMTSLCRAWYTTSGDNSRIIVSLQTHLPMAATPEATGELIERMIGHLFEYRNDFTDAYRDLLRQRGEAKPFDFEATLFNRLRRTHLVRMAETMHGPHSRNAVPDHAVPSYVPTLADTLSALFGVEPSHITGAVVITAGDKPRTLDAAHAAAYTLSADMWHGADGSGLATPPINSWVVIRATLREQGNVPPSAAVDIVVADYGRDTRNGYMSITATIEGGDPLNGVTIESDAWQPRTARTIVAVPLIAGDDGRSEFRYMLGEAREQYASGNFDRLSAEQQLLMRAFVSDTGYHLYHGTAHFNSGRFLQAAVLLSAVFDDMLPRYANMDEEARDAFRDVCFMLGYCNMEFHRYDRAFYYLSITVNNGNYDHDREYINCLVNSGDYRAAELIDHVIEEFENYARDNNVSPQAEEMYHFLRRRRVYLFIESGRLDDAENILRPMVDEEPNREFAIGELAYIRRLRGQSEK